MKKEKIAWSIEVDKKLDEELRKHKAEGGNVYGLRTVRKGSRRRAISD